MRWPVYTLLTACWFAACPRVLAEPPATVLDAAETILLLSNGQTLTGKISRQGDHYLVLMSEGEMRVPAATVDLWCRDLNAAYGRKRSVISGRVEDHLELAHWCIQQRMFDHAQFELSSARALQPNHPKVQLLERSLTVAQNPSDLAPAANPTAVIAGVSNADLDKLVAMLPRNAMEQFTQSVQPMLLNHCATAGCHTPGSPQKLSLLKYTIGKTPSRRATQRNLHSVMQYVNTNEPLASAILKAAHEPHGGAKNSAFTDQQRGQFAELASWVISVSRPSAAQPVPTVPVTGSPLLQTPAAAQAPAAVTPAATMLESKQESGELPAKPADSPLGHSTEPSAPRTEAKTAAASSYTPVDPFDPEVFNRRFLGKSAN